MGGCLIEVVARYMSLSFKINLSYNEEKKVDGDERKL